MSGLTDLAHAARLAAATRPHVPLALATLVAVEGSSYRQPGARLLVDADARVLAGAISGGCLEGDVAARAHDVCARNQSALLTYDLRDDLQLIWGFGSACDGIATVLLEPLAIDAHGDSWLARADAIRNSRHGGAIILQLRDAAAGQPAAGATVAIADGTETIALFGGSRPDALLHAHDHDAALSRGIRTAARTARVHSEPLDGGRLFVEPLLAPIALYVIGAGRGAEAFARIATTLGWSVTITDHRPALLGALHVPPSVRVLEAHAEQAAGMLAYDARTAVALLTHIFDVDREWLARLLPGEASYVGVLGSRQRAASLVDRLRADGVALTTAMLQRLHAPIGLDLGGETPESIALAAIAEIEAVMHGRPGGALRARQSPIHERTPVPHRIERATANPACVVPTRPE